MPTCRSCGAAILWVKMRATDKMMPIDPDAKTMIVRVDSTGKRNPGGDHAVTVRAHVSHWATCPSAEEHRK
jgi:hypothetical protein